MDIVYQSCCGLDVHKKAVTACVITPKGKEIRTFGTMTRDLLSMADWISSQGCTHVAMERTGVYWKPIYNILEQLGLELLVVNAPVEAGYVGSDNVAVLIAEEPFHQDEMMLIIDIGTNGEVVLGSRHRLLSSSCATGPAFEGA